MSDSLTAIKVEPNQCPLHQSILLTQGPIHKIFTKNIENWQSWKELNNLFKGQVFALRFDVRSNRVSVVKLKGKHYRKPHCLNGAVDTFGQ